MASKNSGARLHGNGSIVVQAQPAFAEHTKCLISGSTNLAPLKGYERHYLVKSKPVGFVFCSRIPSQTELEDYYNKYPREYSCSLGVRLRYRELLAEFEPWRVSNKILDVGCGDGLFLEEAMKAGWQVFGTEYSAAVVERCERKGIAMKCGMLNDSWFPPDYFDVITSFEVIEHINNPLQFAHSIHRTLRKGGLLYVTTPNFNALLRYILRHKYNVIEYPEHLCYYTPQTLAYLFTKTGFGKRRINTSGLSISRFMLSVGAKERQEPALREESADEWMLNKRQTSIPFRVSIGIANFFLNLFGVGMSLKGRFTKL